jgi:hypothetical protein
MSLLSKSEVLFLQGKKKVSKSYEYKLKSIIKKKVSNLLDKEIPILSSFSQNSTLLNLVRIMRISKVGTQNVLPISVRIPTLKKQRVKPVILYHQIWFLKKKWRVNRSFILKVR